MMVLIKRGRRRIVDPTADLIATLLFQFLVQVENFFYGIIGFNDWELFSVLKVSSEEKIFNEFI